MARIGYRLRQGTWNSASIFAASYAAVMGQADPSLASLPWVNPGTFPDATSHYGLLWWTNSDGSLAAPTSTYFAWGSYESLIVVIPGLDIVAVRAGGGWRIRSPATTRSLRPSSSRSRHPFRPHR
jgi:CubicO group peptidase (beta-lactamase class C family)